VFPERAISQSALLQTDHLAGAGNAAPAGTTTEYDISVTILNGDCRDVLKTLPDESVHCCITSPPYWGLRDYGNGDAGIGLERTLDEHMAALVQVFGEVRRVLRADGTMWVNYGDAYANDGKWGGETGGKQAYLDDDTRKRNGREKRVTGLKPKDLMGLPWRLAFALQADGWWLRQDIIWHKPNPMPESVTDRCTKAHEYIFLLSKSERYYFDADAIAEDASPNTHARTGKIKMPDGWDTGAGGHGSFHRDGREKGKTREKPPGVTPKSASNDSDVRAKESWHASTTEVLDKRNKRSVWTVPSSPFPDAHFATFPPDLIEPMILAGCPKGGTVLDPFGGAGTTGLVADRLGRNAILIELNPEYATMAERRIRGDAGMFAEVSTARP
jgi:DNA modification methylase